MIKQSLMSLIMMVILSLLLTGCSEKIETSSDYILIISENLLIKPNTYQVLYPNNKMSPPLIKYNGKVYEYYEYTVIEEIK